MARYRTAQQLTERQQQIVKHLPLVRRVIGRMFASLPSFVDRNELFQAGVIGLIQAIDQYNPAEGTRLESYAIPRIRGAILDALRQMDWASRSLRHKATLLERVIDRLCSELGRCPTEEEVAKRLGLELDQYYAMLGEVSTARVLSMDLPFWDEEGAQWPRELAMAIEDAGGLEDEIARADLQERVVAVLQSLPERERLIMVLYYYEELTFKEIGAILGISESRVCQLHTQTILSIRSQLKRDEKIIT